MKILKTIWTDIRGILREIKTNWQLSKTAKGNEMNVNALLITNLIFILGYLASCYVSLIFILFGVIGGIYYGLTESPYGFFLLLLAGLGCLTMYAAHLYWNSFYPRFKINYFKKYGIEEEQEG